MEASGSKMRRVMRDLHNKVGYIIVSLVIIYALSGIVQTYRDTDFLKHEIHNEKVIDAHLDTEKLGKIIKQRELKIEKTEGAVQYFKGGTYNTETGEVNLLPKNGIHGLHHLLNYTNKIVRVSFITLLLHLQ